MAIIWESPVTGAVERYTYGRLLDEVEVLAGVLREEGVRKGDVVIIYSMYLFPFIGVRCVRVGWVRGLSEVATQLYSYPAVQLAVAEAPASARLPSLAGPSASW